MFIVKQVQFLKKTEDLCRFWNICDIPVVNIDETGEKCTDYNGCFNYIAYNIYIKRSACDKDMARTYYHEMRHVWQYHKYRSVYLWWIVNRSEYVRLYQTTACVIEEDARRFAHDVVDLSKTYEDSGAEFLLQSFERLILDVR